MDNPSIIQRAEVLLSLQTIEHAWESSDDISMDEMCDHLEAVIAIVEGKSTLTEFNERTNLNSQSRLN